MKTLASFASENGMEGLLVQWCAEENGDLTPEKISFGSHAKVWWRCENGHKWQAAVGSRARGAGCPYCAGRAVLAGYNDLASLRPDIATVWDREANGGLMPEDVTQGSAKRV